MNKIILVLIVGIIILKTDLYSQTQSSTGTLSFNVTGFLNNTGQVVVELYRKEDKVPKNPFKTVKAEIKNMHSTVKIENLAYGDYAAIIVHDLNLNGVVDHSIGIPVPIEPLGFTNNWKLTLFSGMPSFDKLKFTFNAQNEKFEIKIRE
jgi:uncharacterized protein (DUF2141 family)